MRIHLFEFEDFEWFPEMLRKMITDFLAFQYRTLNLIEPIRSIVFELVHESNAYDVIELCSGSGFVGKEIARHAQDVQEEISLTMTDLFPDRVSLSKHAAEYPNLSYSANPVDATKVGSNMSGVRILSTSFHHFRPPQATEILADAVRNGDSIGVFEVMERSPMAILFTLILPIYVLAVSPFIAPFSWPRMVFTYLVPVFPFVVAWDGFVSCLRSYTEDELRELAAKADEDSVYDWQVGSVTVRPLPAKLTYITGHPKQYINRESKAS